MSDPEDTAFVVIVFGTIGLVVLVIVITVCLLILHCNGVIQ